MSIFGRLLGRAAKVPAAEVIALAERLVQFAQEARGDKEAYRRLLRAAVESGDLDAPLDTYGRANARANDYIEKG